MKNRIIAAGVAGGLLVAAAFAASVLSSPSVAVAEEGDDDTGQTGLIPRTLSFLAEVLNDLVDEGTIDQGQADAILQAAQEKAAAVRADIGEREDEFHGSGGPGFGRGFAWGFGFGSILDDGGIDEDEYDDLVERLPDDHPLATVDVTNYLADGLITPDELRELFRQQWAPGEWRSASKEESSDNTT